MKLPFGSEYEKVSRNQAGYKNLYNDCLRSPASFPRFEGILGLSLCTFYKSSQSYLSIWIPEILSGSTLSSLGRSGQVGERSRGSNNDAFTCKSTKCPAAEVTTINVIHGCFSQLPCIQLSQLHFISHNIAWESGMCHQPRVHQRSFNNGESRA